MCLVDILARKFRLARLFWNYRSQMGEVEQPYNHGYLSGPMMAHSLPVEVGEVGCAHDRTDDRIVHGPGTGMHTVVQRSLGLFYYP
jgi:hypothetical protein